MKYIILMIDQVLQNPTQRHDGLVDVLWLGLVRGVECKSLIVHQSNQLLTNHNKTRKNLVNNGTSHLYDANNDIVFISIVDAILRPKPSPRAGMTCGI